VQNIEQFSVITHSLYAVSFRVMSLEKDYEVFSLECGTVRSWDMDTDTSRQMEI